MSDSPPLPEPVPLVPRLLASLALSILAAIELVYGLAAAPFAATFAANQPGLIPWLAWARGGVAGLLFVGLPVAIALLTALSAIGTATGHRAGWFVGLAAALLWLPTGCLPLSAMILAVLMLPGVRGRAGHSRLL